jgi:acyl-CoA synthetase (AMP-forming)/AMP-acid ligase II/acyl carrier protein
MPLFHIHGLVAALLASLAAGASVVCTPGFFAPQFFPWLEAFHPTWYTAVPTMQQAILARAPANQEIINRAVLRLVRSCSASLPPQLMAELESTFNVPVIEAYGMTEASHQMASNPLPPNVYKPGSVGVAAGPQVAIMAEASDRLLQANEIGEIVIRGPNVMHGYINNPEANARAFDKGWFRTGDQGYIDDQGYVFITGRLKEIINRGGEKISPREVDEVLLDHPAVAQAVTFALPDAELGEDVGAAVILTDPAVTEKELRRFASLRLAPFKVPRKIVIVDNIPKGPTGKIQRIGLAETLGLYLEPQKPVFISGTFVAPGTEIEESLAEMWCKVLGLIEVSVQQRFLDLGGDSILATQLVARMSQTFDVPLTLLDFFDAPTISEQAVIIEGYLLDEIESLSNEEVDRLSTDETGLDE